MRTIEKFQAMAGAKISRGARMRSYAQMCNDHLGIGRMAPETWEVRTPMTFTLVCERREDGGLRVTSPDVPGLILSGADCRAVLRDVAPAIDVLTKHNK